MPGQLGMILYAAVHMALTLGCLALLATYTMPYYVYEPSITDNQLTSTSAVLPESLQVLGGWLPSLSTYVLGDAADADAKNTHVLWRAATTHLALAAVTFVTVSYIIVAPYGRHAAGSRMPFRIPSRLSWVLQECPTLLNVVYFVFFEYPLLRSHANGSEQPMTYRARVDEAWLRFYPSIYLFLCHYIHRSLIYPLMVSSSANQVPLHVTWSATLYCLFNGRLQVLASQPNFLPFDGSVVAEWRSYSALACLSSSWASLGGEAASGAAFLPLLLSVLAILGFILFCYGMYVNVSSDYYLISLKAKRSAHDGAVGYEIPYGQWFDRVSCPNFFGEIMEWAGYALFVPFLSWFSSSSALCGQSVTAIFSTDAWMAQGAPTLAAFSFFVYVLANLVPRAVAHHQWYCRTFGESYTTLRRSALIPGVL